MQYATAEPVAETSRCAIRTAQAAQTVHSAAVLFKLRCRVQLTASPAVYQLPKQCTACDNPVTVTCPTNSLASDSHTRLPMFLAQSTSSARRKTLIRKCSISPVCPKTPVLDRLTGAPAFTVALIEPLQHCKQQCRSAFDSISNLVIFVDKRQKSTWPSTIPL